MQNQRTANGHTLALTAGQFVRPRVLAIGKSHAAKQPDRFSLHLGLIAFLHEQPRMVMLPSTVLFGNKS
mgnify:FL=1